MSIGSERYILGGTECPGKGGIVSERFPNTCVPSECSECPSGVLVVIAVESVVCTLGVY